MVQHPPSYERRGGGGEEGRRGRGGERREGKGRGGKGRGGKGRGGKGESGGWRERVEGGGKAASCNTHGKRPTLHYYLHEGGSGDVR